MPQFKIDIPSEAETLRREKKEYSLHPSLHRRLEEFAKASNSSPDYVLAHIMDSTLPAAKPEKAQAKGPKEVPGKAA